MAQQKMKKWKCMHCGNIIERVNQPKECPDCKSHMLEDTLNFGFLSGSWQL